MGFFSFLFGGKRSKTPAPQEDPGLDLSLDLDSGDSSSRAADLVNDLSDAIESDTSNVGIWDFAESKSQPTSDVDLDAVTEAVAAATGPSRGRRNKTRLIGFETSRDETVDLFAKEEKEEKEEAKPAATQHVQFPVGWLVVIAGPGRGTSFSLLAGLASIGRDDDQTVQLDFGDAAISRSNHASVAYDSETNTFLLGHGGKSNIVRLNGAPLLSTEPLENGDLIRVGETMLRFVAMCDEEFNWTTGELDMDEPTEEADNVATA